MALLLTTCAEAGLYGLIGKRIGDPNHDEVPTTTTMLGWINVVNNDAAILTDCFQASGSITGAANAESYSVSTLTGLIRILDVVDKTSGISYRPVSRTEYHGYRNNIVGNSLSGVYVYNLFGYDAAGRKIYILPTVVTDAVVTIEYSLVEDAIADTAAPQGLLANYAEIFIEGVAAIYFDASGDSQEADKAFGKYMMWINKLNGEVGINPSIKPEASLLWREGYGNRS